MSTKNLFWLLPLVTLAACANGGSGNDSYSPSAATTPEAFVQTDSTAGYAAGKPLNSPERKIVHTADFHCKVKNVFTATTQLEEMVKSVGGVVQDSRIDNSSSDINTSYYTADSLKQTQTYTTTATLTLRVPVASMDSVIHAIPGMASFIDSRTLKQSDVTYRYLSNELKNQVGNEKATSERAMKLAKKSKDPIDVQQYENNRQENKIDRKMENLQLMDDVTYATVTVAFSQPEQVFMQIVIDPSYYTQNPFSLKCKQALYSGWTFVTAFAIALINIWPILLLLIASMIIFRRLRTRRLAIVKR